jgi:hypothetical protein
MASDLGIDNQQVRDYEGSPLADFFQHPALGDIVEKSGLDR